MKVLTLLPLVFSIGCKATVDNAAKIVWNDVYHAKCEMPRVVWETSAVLLQAYQTNEPCMGHHNGMCVKGFYSPYSNTVHILVEQGQRLHNTGLSHELLHAYLKCMGFTDSDAEHKSEVWNKMVDTANKQLEKSGWF